MQTPRPNVYLAGAWLASDWPATMEAAVRSGVAAAHSAAVRRVSCAHGVTSTRRANR